MVDDRVLLEAFHIKKAALWVIEVWAIKSNITFQQNGCPQEPQLSFDVLVGGILNPKISLGEGKYSFISCPFIDWLITGGLSSIKARQIYDFCPPPPW